ncbi:LamG-like jellyroll fold domain-containing protein [Coraliomargarita algicola]|uniref:alpha-L-rhamnosidase n=1 Tax=Coraliomargarita algicola TaxID=3092156 RepID=A0ABZ0RM29_9BACT|nr:LamG-like jellyroll fold domain-containing protein [Coraliomargarita sp. J2-16]WPJ97274.1 LamG-like jellyroll fold domain-containing protein [Coraliomargarita sp. J2-16]
MIFLLNSIHRLAIVGMALSVTSSYGQTYAPYTVDAHTVYLLHLDEVAGSGMASWEGSGGGTGAYTVDISANEVTDVLGASGLFGGAANMMGPSSHRGIGIDVDSPSDGFEYGDEINFNTIISNGQFTLEALVKPSVSDLTEHGHIWSMDSGDGSRGGQFRLNSSEQLEWHPIDLGGDGPVSISVGTITPNSWYHAAITYSDGNYTMYWTPVDGGSSQAHVLHTWTSPLTTTNLTAELMLGNEGRSGLGSTESFPGLIDEARISNVARGPFDFIFKINDIDEDGLLDDWERFYIGSLAEGGKDDHDRDGFTNAQEFAAGTNPYHASSVPGDTDADGLTDDWELAHFGDLSQSGVDDPDGDSSNNSSEQASNTDPNNSKATPGFVDSTTPTGLMVDLLAYPHRTTIPDTEPEFTWIFHPAMRGDHQTAYQIIVSSSNTLARSGTGDVWDSGKVSSGESVDVAYAAGSELMRGNGYFWRVRTWGVAETASDWSFVQSFRIEASTPQAGSRSLYMASAADANGFDWAGRYQPAFGTVVVPVKVVDKGNGNFFIDFGQDAFGYITLQLDGSFAGESMEIRFGEKASGMSVDTSPGASIRYSATTKTLSDGNVTYEIRPPTTVYPPYYDATDITGWAGDVTPFRYIELIGCPTAITAGDIRQWVLHTPFDDDAARFTSSDDTLNKVWEMCRYSMKATTFCGVYVDGDRERCPYEADAYLNQLTHYAVDREYTLARYSYEYLLDHTTWPTEWRMHFPLMAWADYMYTGNSDALAASYDDIKAFLLSDRERASDNLVASWPNNGTGANNPSDIIDWPRSERDGYVQTSYSSVINAFHYRNLRLMAQMADVLGKTADSADYTARANTIETSFNSVFWNGSQYQDGESSTHVSAHGNFFPMAFGLVPSSRVSSVMDYLKTKRMAPSVYGAQYLLEALFEGGESDYAIGLMADNDPDYKRHWYNMLLEGATITMEAWDNDFKSNTDWNHAWGAAPGNIIPTYVLGLKPLTAGFGEVEIKPQLGTGDGANGLTHAAGTIPTIRGPVTINIENSPTNFQLTVEIPGNMAATVSLPSKGLASPVVLYNGKVVTVPVTDGRLVIENVPGGKHSFWLSATHSPDAATLKANWKEAMFGEKADNPEVSGDELDWDGDGATTEEEFIANTDPTNAADRWMPHMIFNAPIGPFESTFSGKGGRRYTLERSPSLLPTSWTDVDTKILSTDTDVRLVDSFSATSNTLFYRTRVELP